MDGIFKARITKDEKMQLMGHIVSGYPNFAKSLDSALGIIDGGASYIEIQFPFSDPCADGEIIQNACDVSLKNGWKIEDGWKLAEILSKKSKIIIVTYANIIFKYGIREFISKAKEKGVYGIIIPDLIMGSDENIKKYANGINVISLITPNTPKERMKQIIKYSQSIIYVAARRGVTGETTTSIDTKLIYEIKNLTNKKIALGFGINSKKQILEIKNMVDIVVVGSYFVKIIGSINNNHRIRLKEVTNKLINI